MKRLRYIISAVLLAGATLIGTSCEGVFEDDVYNNGGNGGHGNNNNNNDGPEEDVPGSIEDFQATLEYISTNPNSMGAFDVDSKKVVSNNNSAADIVLCWQNNYGYVITQPKSSFLKQLYEANNKEDLYSNNNTCTIMNMGQTNISYYADKNSLYEMSLKPGSIPDLAGSNQVQVEPGDVIAFKTNSGAKGVAKISSLSKVTKHVTLKGYIYYPN